MVYTRKLKRKKNIRKKTRIKKKNKKGGVGNEAREKRQRTHSNEFSEEDKNLQNNTVLNEEDKKILDDSNNIQVILSNESLKKCMDNRTKKHFVITINFIENNEDYLQKVLEEEDCCPGDLISVISPNPLHSVTYRVIKEKKNILVKSVRENVHSENDNQMEIKVV